MRSYSFFLLILLLDCANVIYTKDNDLKGPKDYDKVLFEWIDTFAEVAHHVKQKHFKVTDLDAPMTNAIESFLTTLDPHSGFFPPKTYKNILSTMSGEFCGIGIMIDGTRQSKDRFLTIVDVIPDGPADKAGVKPLDKIVEIDGTILEGMTSDEAIAKMKGKKDTKVTVKIMRESKSDLFTFEITRDVIKDQTTLCFFLNDFGICYLSLAMFTENSVNNITKLLEQVLQKSCKALILDLRNNSGGLLNAAVDIVGLFAEKGSVVVITKDKNGKEIDRSITKRRPLEHIPPIIVILINNYTASAAEILAGCLKIYSDQNKVPHTPIVVLVGMASFGKGSVQEIIPVGHDCAVKITSALYYLPDNSSIQGVGLEPDVTIEKKIELPEQVAWFNKHYGREKALANYIKQNDSVPEKEEPKDKAEPKNWKERAKKLLASDNQFLEAVSVINILDTAKQLMPKSMTSRKQAVSFLKKHYASEGSIVMTEIKA